jgi:uncharacterized membrane protein YphA (DoxX/SURF4 family)
MTNLTNPIRLQIAEKSAGSLNFLALLRWAMVIIFLWFGAMKFTAYEAAGIAPFIEHSPIMSWLHALFGIQGASYVAILRETLGEGVASLGEGVASIAFLGVASRPSTPASTAWFKEIAPDGIAGCQTATENGILILLT